MHVHVIGVASYPVSIKSQHSVDAEPAKLRVNDRGNACGRPVRMRVIVNVDLVTHDHSLGWDTQPHARLGKLSPSLSAKAIIIPSRKAQQVDAQAGSPLA